MLHHWLVRQPEGKEIHGPFTTLEVVERIRSGQFSLGSFICEEGFATWTPISQRRDILQALDMNVKERLRQSRATIDASRIDEMVMTEQTTSSSPDKRAFTIMAPSSRRWGWILGLLLILAALLGFSLLFVWLRPLTPTPPPEEQKTDGSPVSLEPERKSERPGEITEQQPQQPRTLGISRYSSFDPSEVLQRSEGPLMEKDQGIRRRMAAPPPGRRKTFPAPAPSVPAKESQGVDKELDEERENTRFQDRSDEPEESNFGEEPTESPEVFQEEPSPEGGLQEDI